MTTRPRSPRRGPAGRYTLPSEKASEPHRSPISSEPKLYCDACERARPAQGFVQERRYLLCADCALEYAAGIASKRIASAGQYVRDKHFGEGESYALLQF
jgi:hypothetical protein